MRTKYPLYIYNISKYCCRDKPFTEQELLDYINFLLKNAMSNVSNTVFLKYEENINYLKKYREFLLENNPKLKNELTREKLEIWILESKIGALRSKMAPYNRTPFKRSRENKYKNNSLQKKRGGTRKNIRSLTKQTIKKNKKSKSKNNKIN